MGNFRRLINALKNVRNAQVYGHDSGGLSFLMIIRDTKIRIHTILQGG